jgi:hypothetical protein
MPKSLLCNNSPCFDEYFAGSYDPEHGTFYHHDIFLNNGVDNYRSFAIILAYLAYPDNPTVPWDPADRANSQLWMNTCTMASKYDMAVWSRLSDAYLGGLLAQGRKKGLSATIAELGEMSLDS